MLYLLRHGKAARRDPDGPRSLTPQGREEVKSVAEYFKNKGLKVEALWHSPKTRAVETSGIFLDITGKTGVKVVEKKELKPEGDAQQVYQEINQNDFNSMLVVTHLPFVGELASLLAGDSLVPEFGFPTAGVAAFERRGKTWKWLWSLDPSTLK